MKSVDWCLNFHSRSLSRFPTGLSSLWKSLERKNLSFSSVQSIHSGPRPSEDIIGKKLKFDPQTMIWNFQSFLLLMSRVEGDCQQDVYLSWEREAKKIDGCLPMEIGLSLTNFCNFRSLFMSLWSTQASSTTKRQFIVRQSFFTHQWPINLALSASLRFLRPEIFRGFQIFLSDGLGVMRLYCIQLERENDGLSHFRLEIRYIYPLPSPD